MSTKVKSKFGKTVIRPELLYSMNVGPLVHHVHWMSVLEMQC